MYRTLSKLITNNCHVLQSKMSNIDRSLHKIELKNEYLNKKIDFQNSNFHRQLTKYQLLKESKPSSKKSKSKKPFQKQSVNKIKKNLTNKNKSNKNESD